MSYFLRGCRIVVALEKINTEKATWMCAVLMAWGRQTYEEKQGYQHKTQNFFNVMQYL
jgi:hypothetical protein